MKKKEKRIFLSSILIGLSSGFVSAITVTAMYRFIDTDYSLANILTLIVGLIAVSGICIWLIKEMKK